MPLALIRASRTVKPFGVKARLVRGGQAVDDLLVVSQLVVGVLDRLDDRPEQRNPADVELGEFLAVALLLDLGRWPCRSRPAPSGGLDLGRFAVPLAPPACWRKIQERMPPSAAITAFSGSTARGSSTNFQVSPILIISGAWRNATSPACAWPFARPGKITAFS